jgi:PucR family transcriptional regulator, purine catabolism regulatory protein
MRLSEVLALPVCQGARLVETGLTSTGADLTRADLTREVTLAHVIDVPQAERWVGVQTLLLTTGLSWPRTPSALRAFGERLAARQPAAVVLAVPGPLSAFPPEVARALARAGIPALTLPYEVPFAAVVQAVHQGILQEQAVVLGRSEAIHRALTRAALEGGLGDVAETLSLHLGRPVALIGASGERLLAAPVSAGHVPAAPALLRALSLPGSAPRTMPGGGLLAPVLVHGERSGALWIGAESPTPLDETSPERRPAPENALEDDLVRRSAEQACTVAALLLLAQRDLEAREVQLGSAVTDTLLEGRFVAESGALDRARRLGFEPESAYTVALLDLLEPLPLTEAGVIRRGRLAGELRSALGALGTPPLLSPGLGHIWFLLPHSLSPERLWALLSPQTQARVGLVYSRPRLGAAGVAQGRAEVLSLAAHAVAGTVKGYTELLIPRALSGDVAAQGDLIAALLGPLRSVRGGQKLTETVRVLCACGWAQDRAAAQLGIHKNTLRYRMDRAETLSATSLADPDTRTQWWLAFQLDALRTSPSPE